MENSENKEKLTFTEWLENTWYHNKWMIIFGGMLVLFLIISVGQLASSSSPDLKVLHVGPMYISPEAADRIESTLEGFSEDYNDDGDFTVDILDITVNKLSDVAAAWRRILSDCRSGAPSADGKTSAFDGEFISV